MTHVPVRIGADGRAPGVRKEMQLMQRHSASTTTAKRGAAWGMAAAWLAGALVLAGCTIESVEWRNRQPAQELARQQQPPGTVYAGWRVYQQRCASCHGPNATGGERAPDLLFRLRDVGAQRFVDLVLRRYDWDLPGAPRETLVDEVVARGRGELEMPAWQGEPVVSAHIMDLYAYLSARAAGTLGPGRPAP